MTQAAIATIGHNKPPEMVAFEAIEAHISDCYDEAKAWLDGEPVTTQDQANAINTLITRIREAEKEADGLRKKEVKPHDDAKKAIQDRYNPLIGKTKTITGKTHLAIEAAKAAVKPYLDELDRQQREAERLAREEADRKAREAQEAMQARQHDNLETVEQAERLAAEAAEAEKEANRAAKAKAHAKGEGRATALRTVWKAEIVDRRQAASWAMNSHQEDFLEWIQDKANKAVRAGKREIPGFNVKEERVL